mmetsp:Transcript_14557/g.37730  ORF Transcript_14557/g.37730 Transcript_14557/m.37730 type:complete len:282 (+) Transcript_14557:2-847(+)
MFARHTLLDGSKTNYTDFVADVENRILPECLLQHLVAMLRVRRAEVERQQAEAEQSRQMRLAANQPEQADGADSQGDAVMSTGTPRRQRSAAGAAMAKMCIGAAGLSTSMDPRTPVSASPKANGSSLKRKEPSPTTNAGTSAANADRLKGIRAGPSADVWARVTMPDFIVAQHKAYSSIAKQLPAKKSPRTAVGCWVAVKQIHNLIGNEGVPHWIGMALKTVGKGSETGRYLVHFTGIGWHGQNRPVVNTSMIKLKEARDTEEEPFIILQADPLAKRKLPV